MKNDEDNDDSLDFVVDTFDVAGFDFNLFIAPDTTGDTTIPVHTGTSATAHDTTHDTTATIEIE